MAWLRLYDSVLDSHKIDTLPPALFKALIKLWCVAKRGRGAIESLTDAAYMMRASERDVANWLAELEKRRLIDRLEDGTFQPHDWDEHQFVSDNVSARVRKHREKRRENGADSLLPASPETATAPPEQSRANQTQRQTARVLNCNQEREGEEQGRDFARFWSSFPRVPNASKAKAREVFERLAGDGRLPALPQLLAAVSAYSSHIDEASKRRKAGDPLPVMHPANWLAERRFEAWLDERDSVSETEPAGPDIGDVPELAPLRERFIARYGAPPWRFYLAPSTLVAIGEGQIVLRAPSLFIANYASKTFAELLAEFAVQLLPPGDAPPA